jgi:hypothetical protein
MKKEWQNQHVSEESVPVQAGGPTALKPPEDFYQVMEGRLILVPGASETVEELGADGPARLAARGALLRRRSVGGSPAPSSRRTYEPHPWTQKAWR